MTDDSVSRTPPQWHEGGFTLVELICVLVVLGALAAVAIPRFIVLTVDAHRAAVAATAGAFGSALRLANLACTVRGWANRDNLPGYGNSDVDFNPTCYPTDTSGNSNVIGNNRNRCLRVWNAVLMPAPTITNGAAGADYRASARSDVCTYEYLPDTSVTRQFTYDSRNGLVVVTNP